MSERFALALCETCSGTGETESESHRMDCPDCLGTGYVEPQKRILNLLSDLAEAREQHQILYEQTGATIYETRKQRDMLADAIEFSLLRSLAAGESEIRLRSALAAGKEEAMIQLEEKAAEALVCVQKAEKLMAELGHTKYSLSGMISAAMRHDLEKEVSILLGELAEARKQRDTLVKALEQCLEDSEELLAERDWWKNEPRCSYQKDHAELVARVEKAKQALAAVKGGSMTKQERISRFVAELADLCERYDVAISTESMCNWSPALAEDEGFHAILPTFATPSEIRNAKADSSAVAD